MSPTESVSIVATSDLNRLGRFKKAWWVGWVLAFSVGGISTYHMGKMNGKFEQASKLHDYEFRLSQMEDRDQAIVDKFVAAWEGNNRLGDALGSWTEYLKDRATLIHENANARR